MKTILHFKTANISNDQNIAHLNFKRSVGKKLTSKFYILLLAFSLLAGQSAWAQLQVYTDRAAWEAALAAPPTNIDWSSVSSDQTMCSGNVPEPPITVGAHTFTAISCNFSGINLDAAPVTTGFLGGITQIKWGGTTSGTPKTRISVPANSYGIGFDWQSAPNYVSTGAHNSVYLSISSGTCSLVRLLNPASVGLTSGFIGVISPNGGINTYDVYTTFTNFGTYAITNFSYSTDAVPPNLPTVPTLSASDNPTCSGSSTTLSIATGDLNNAEYWKWYSGSCGGSSIGSGTSIVVNPTATTTYYARGEGCFTPGSCGSITVNLIPLWYLDADNDGYHIGTSVCSASSPGAGYNTTSVLGGDCDDSNPAVNPVAVEICDGIDNNCDGLTDNDVDGDGISTCDGDCDDTNAFVYPGAPEICDGLDNNCDGIVETSTAYFIPLSDTNLTSNCSNGSRYNNCASDLEITWTDTNTAVSSAFINFNVGVDCSGGSKTVFLNEVSQGTISPNAHCSCAESPQPFTITLNPADYNANGSNTLRVQAGGTCFGLNDMGSDVFATVCVDTGTADPCDNDAEDPTVTATSDVTANTSDDGAGDCTVDVAISDATFEDNCSSNLTWEMTGVTTDTGVGQVGTHTFNLGETTITYTNTDDSNNTTTDAMTVTVSDDENPTIACVANMERDSAEGVCTYKVVGTEFDPTEFDDNCTGSTISNDFNGSDSLADAVFDYGTTTVIWTVTDDSDNTATCSFDVNVNKVTTTILVTVAPNPEQYSDLVTFTATILPAADCVGAGAICGLVTFKVNDQVMGTASVTAGVATLANVALLELPVGTYPGNGSMNPSGIETVEAILAACGNYLGDSVTSTTALDITCEDAAVTNTGDSYFTANPNTGAGTVALSAFVEDDADGNRGDIRNATVTFHEGTTGGSALGTADIPVGLIDTAVTTDGFASTDLNINLTSQEQSSGGRLTEVWTTANNYYCGEDDEGKVVTLAMPGGDFVTGGGYILQTNTSGQYPGLNSTGKKMNFGFVMKWNKSGKRLQGRVNIIYRGVDGHNYKIKSNSIKSLSVTTVIEGSDTYKKAVITTKANLKRLNPDGTSDDLGGNLTLIVTAWENQTIHTGHLDRIGVQLSGNGGSGIYFTSNWSGGSTMYQTLDGGKIQVRNSSNSSSARTAAITSVKTDLEVISWPNPSDSNFNIKVTTDNKLDTVNIQVMDMIGKRVHFDDFDSDESYKFGESFQAGIYFVRISQGEFNKTLRVIKR